MNIHLFLQAYHNKRKMLPVFIMLLLSFLVLAFCTSVLWNGIISVTNDDFEMNYENIYAINIRWKKIIAEDSLLLEIKKDNLIKELNKRPEISFSTFSPSKLIGHRRNVYSKLSTAKQEHIYIPVGEGFAETFDLSFIQGRGFQNQDILQPYSAVIIFQSLADQEGITSLDEKTFVTMKQWSYKSQQHFDKKLRVVGIIEDISFLKNKDNYSSCIFSFSKERKTKFTNNIYLKMRDDTSREKVVALFSGALKNNGMEEWANTFQTRSADEIKRIDLMLFLKNIKIILFIVLLLITYVAFTLFGVFYRHVLNNRSEFAIRRSFGCSQWGIYRKVMFEALLYSLPGVLVGAFIFANIAMLTNTKHIVPSVLLPVALILLIVALSVFFPALYISRQTPVEAFHDE